MIQLNQNIQDLQKFNINARDLVFLIKDLNIGQVLRSKVLEIPNDNEVLLLLNGQKILAQTSLNLEIGDNIYLKVLALKPSITLQFYGIESGDAKDPKLELLRMLNLDKDRLNQEIVSAIIKYNLPLNKSDIQEIFSLLSEMNKYFDSLGRNANSFDGKLLSELKLLKIPITDEKIINSITFLKSSNIPVTSFTVLNSIAFLNNEQNLGKILSQLKALLENNLQLQDVNKKLAQLFESKNPDNLIKSLGLEYEKNVSDLLRIKNFDDQQNLGIKGIVLEILQTINNNPKLENSDLLHLLSFQILNNIEMQQLLNKSSVELNKGWIFQIPVPSGNGFDTIELKIQQEKASRNFKNGKKYFNLKIDLTSIGQVIANGNVVDKNLSCTFELENENYCKLFEDEFTSLKTKINDLGYSVGSLETKIFNEGINSFANAFVSTTPITNIDYKA